MILIPQPTTLLNLHLHEPPNLLSSPWDITRWKIRVVSQFRAFSTPWITLWFPPILPFHQLGFSWNKRISLPKLCLSGALPTRVFGRELIWPFTPIQRNRFRHHHGFSDQKNMIVKMGSSSSIFGVKIKSMSCHHPDYIVYWLIKKGILF